MRRYPLLIGNKGITLVESVVAVLIIGIATGSVLGAFIVGKYTVERSKHRVAAIGYISGKIEEIMETSYSSVTQSNFPAETMTIDDRGTPVIGDDLTGTLTVTVTEIVAGIDGYKKVSAILNWTEKAWGGSNNLSESVTTYIVQE